MSASIHPTAIISEGAIIGSGTMIGPYSIIGPHVRLGENNVVGPHVVVEGRTTIGAGNKLFQFASVGAPPQDLKYRGEESRLEIGDGNIIREGVTLSPGTSGGGLITRIGDRNLFMAMSHVGHDGLIGHDNVFANSAALAGHVIVGNRVIVGGLAGIHQFVRLGDFSILSGGSMVVKDIPPFCIAQGDRCHLVGINRIALERAGFDKSVISRLRQLYRTLFTTKGRLADRLAAARQEFGSHPECSQFLEFFENSQRGVTTPRKGGDEQSDGDEN